MLSFGSTFSASSDPPLLPLEYRGDPRSSTDAELRIHDVGKAVKAWHEALRASPGMSFAAGCIISKTAPDTPTTPDYYKAGLTAGELAAVEKEDLEDGRKFAIKYVAATRLIASKIHLALGPVAKDKMEAIKEYESARNKGEVKDMIDEITAKFSSTC